MQEICILLFSVEISVSLYSLLQVASNLIPYKSITYTTSLIFSVIRLTINYRIEVQCTSSLLRPIPLGTTQSTQSDLGISTKKKFFRVAPTRFGSVRLNTPVPLCALCVSGGCFGCVMFVELPKYPPEVPKSAKKSKSSIFEQLNPLKVRHLHPKFNIISPKSSMIEQRCGSACSIEKK